MPNNGHFWTAPEVQELISAWKKKPVNMSRIEFARLFAEGKSLTENAVAGKIKSLEHEGRVDSGTIKDSPYPAYDSPLVTEGDALVITDLELPFHHADFVNRVLDVADKWKITNLILGGDALHFDSLSGWEPNWIEKKRGGLADNDEAKLMDFAKGLNKKKQDELFSLIGSMGEREEQDGASTELDIARREISRLEKQFERIDFILGNHEGRFLRAMQTALSPQELTRLLGVQGVNSKWRIAPYYYGILLSGGEKFQIEHPKNSTKASAWRLASKYGCHVLMGHNHHVVFQFDMSGKYYALEIGCCVDEARLPYAAQRHNGGHAHALGACIVRDGYPWLFHAHTDWERMKRL